MNAKKITEAAVLIAIYIVMLLIFLYIPILATIISFVLPLPFIFYTAKYGWKYGLLFFTAAMALSFIVGSVLALSATGLYGLTGAVMGYGIYAQKGRLFTYIAATMAFLFNMLFQYALAALLFEMNFFQEFIGMVDESVQNSAQILQMLGQEVPAEMLEIMDRITETITILMPTLLVLASALVVLALQLINYPILKKLRLNVPDAKPFRELTLPKSLIWYFLIVLLISFFVPDSGSGFMYNAILNLVYIMQALFIFQGVTFVFYFAYAKKIPKAIPVIIIIFALLNPLFNELLRILGIVDVGFELRKRIKFT